ncbi:MAG TPA: YciI family protein [Thermoanaerobaculia bacterium]|nr:YciI family protein [Thermoanaerobaculia bacterium]
MRYLCLIYLEETKLNALSESEYGALVADALAYDDELRRSGHFVVSDALQPVESATTLRVRNGHLSITDGPFAETREQLGGFILIQARDLNEAIHVASRIPPGRLGSIEVRPVQELAQQEETSERSMPCK